MVVFACGGEVEVEAQEDGVIHVFIQRKTGGVCFVNVEVVPHFSRRFHITTDGTNFLGCAVSDDEKELHWVPIPEDENKRARISKTREGETRSGQKDIVGDI